MYQASVVKQEVTQRARLTPRECNGLYNERRGVRRARQEKLWSGGPLWGTPGWQ